MSLLQGAAFVAVVLTALAAVQSYPLQGGYGDHVGNHGSKVVKDAVDYDVSLNSRIYSLQSN
jgi:hypothetical protein